MVFLPGEEGQGLVEYGLILILIAVAVFAVVGLVGQTLIPLFERVTDAIGFP